MFMTQRLEYIDQLKGLAMLLVVIGHIIVFCGLGYDNIFIRNITMMNMPLFFFLNGLVISEKMSLKGLLRKTYQLLLPFISWGALMVLYRNSSFMDFLFHYWKYGYWYLLVLLEFFIAQVGLNYINWLVNKKKRWWIDVLVFLLLYQTLRFSARFISDEISVLIDYWQFVAYFPYFFLGAFIKRHFLIDKMLTCGNLIITLILLFLLPLYMLWYNEMYMSIVQMVLPINIFLLLFMIFGLFSVEYNQSSKHRGVKIVMKINAILSMIGKHTLSIYMMQFFLFRFINLDTLFSLLYEGHNYFAIFFISALIAILFCYLCMLGEWILMKSQLLSFLFFGKNM